MDRYTVTTEIVEKPKSDSDIDVKAELKALRAEIAELRDEIELWEETWKIQNNPELSNRILNVEKNLKEGRFLTREQLLKEVGLSEDDF
jgi:molybdopterin converting factor small subunit